MNISSMYKIHIIQTHKTIPTFRWDIGKFGACSKSCGRGERRRTVVCRFMPETGYSPKSIGDSSKISKMPELMCPKPKPAEVEPCGFGTCPPKWVRSGLGQVWKLNVTNAFKKNCLFFIFYVFLKHSKFTLTFKV